MGLPIHVAAAKGVGGSVNGATVWVPDYYGRYVLINEFASDGALSTSKLPLASQSCNPNAVTVQNTLLYVVCSSGFGGVDQILVYNTNPISYLKTITGVDAWPDGYFVPAG